jgi:hypothetical protein
MTQLRVLHSATSESEILGQLTVLAVAATATMLEC